MAITGKESPIRSAVRFPLRLPVAVKDGLDEHQAETQNISSGGVLFAVDAEMKVGTEIEFAIAMPSEVLGAPTDVLVNCVGRVVRCSQEAGRRTVAAIIDEYRFDRA